MANKSFWPLICTSVLSLLFVGCGGGSSNITPPPVQSKPEFLYVSSIASSSTAFTTTISAFKFDTQAGTATPTTSISKDILALPFTVDPASRFLYISDVSVPNGAIDIFSIDPATGAPSAAGQFPIPPPTCGPTSCTPFEFPGALVMNPAGSFLFYASANQGPPGQEIGSLSAGGSGALNAVSGSPFPAGTPYVIAMHPSGKFIYTEDIEDPLVSFMGVHSVSGYSVDSNGVVTSVPNSPLLPAASAKIGVLAVHPSGKFLYATTGTMSNGLLAWSINSSTGELTTLANTPFLSGNSFPGAAIHPGGKFLYLSLLSGSGIAGFSVDPTSGTLTQLSNSPFDTRRYTVLSTDLSGQYLFAADLTGTNIYIFKIDPSTGILSAVGSPISMGGRVLSITVAKAP